MVDLFVINKVREKRKELGISQRGLAAILERSPSFSLIAQFFDCSLADFFPPINFDI